MQVAYDQDRIADAFRHSVATLGMFDGVHRGHQSVIAEAIRWAEELHTKTAAITFSTHPRTVLHGAPPAFITSLEHRLVLLDRLGIDLCLVLTFERRLAECAPEDFVTRFLCQRFAPEAIVLGFDCRFGKGGRGNFELLRELGETHGFQARQCAPVLYRGQPISSTLIRQAILRGGLEEAAEMLGRPVTVLGTVVKGSGLGRSIGYPTANLDLHHEARPPTGIYAVKALHAGNEYPALASIGTRPTFTPDSEEVLIEVHLLDFDGDLYGASLEVQFVTQIREQKRFASQEELVGEIQRDERATREILGKG